MPSQREIAAALHGAYRLARADPGGMAWFDVSDDGFLRSFFALVLVAPFYALLVAVGGEAGAAGPVAVIAIKGLAYVIGWLAFPVAAIYLTRLLGLEHNYVPLVVAYNWCAVLQVAAYVPVILIQASGLLPPGMAGTLVFLIMMAVLLYQWFVVRTALETTTSAAIALVVIDVLFGILVNSMSIWMLA